MAPEQFRGKAVFASDVYSLGVTMYQVLTGTLPYESPGPANLDRLMRADLITPPRVRNPKVPKAISDITLKAMAPEITQRYQRAGDLLDAVLSARPQTAGARRPWRPAATAGGTQPSENVQDIQSRLRARETPQGRFCWKCAKPLHARTGKCPFCGESQ